MKRPGSTLSLVGAARAVGDLVWGRVVGTDGVDLIAREEASG